MTERRKEKRFKITKKCTVLYNHKDVYKRFIFAGELYDISKKGLSIKTIEKKDASFFEINGILKVTIFFTPKVLSTFVVKIKHITNRNIGCLRLKKTETRKLN